MIQLYHAYYVSVPHGYKGKITILGTEERTSHILFYFQLLTFED